MPQAIADPSTPHAPRWSRPARAAAAALLCLLGTAAWCQGQGQDLMAARAEFKTRLIPNDLEGIGPADTPPAGTFMLLRYPAPAGALSAYLTPDPKDGRKHPALLWLRGGWGGIGSSMWSRQPDSQAPNAFRDAKFVVMTPSRRGENDNPGKMEFFFGEVDDTVAAIDYLASLPYVDARRIYVGGHSTGGTLALLVAMASPTPRAVFSFGGRIDMAQYAVQRAEHNLLPFDWKDKEEIRLRNPLAFAASIKAPLYYFEGERGVTSPEELRRFAQLAAQARRPFQGHLIPNADHFNALQPLLQWLALELKKDALPLAPFTRPLAPPALGGR